MPTIIQHKPTGNHYILLGAGYGVWASARPNRVFGDILSKDEQGEHHLLCVADENGNALWIRPDDAQVISVAGQSPADILKGF